jgi:hypothetical protein
MREPLGFQDIGTVGGVHLYRARERPVLQSQIEGFGTPSAARLAVQRTRAADDRLEFATSVSDAPTILLVSQQFHPQWRARGRKGSAEIALETFAVDDFWQGVKLPPGTREVALEFRPWVRFAWIPQLLFSLAAAGLAAAAILRRQRTRTTATSPTRLSTP